MVVHMIVTARVAHGPRSPRSPQVSVWTRVRVDVDEPTVPVEQIASWPKEVSDT
jgi:hypothetical protein